MARVTKLAKTDREMSIELKYRRERPLRRWKWTTQQVHGSHCRTNSRGVSVSGVNAPEEILKRIMAGHAMFSANKSDPALLSPGSLRGSANYQAGETDETEKNNQGLERPWPQETLPDGLRFAEPLFPILGWINP
jgi:hypothetical protein